MSDLKHIHNAIIDNPDFNLTVSAKRDLRELCAWVESYRKDGQKVLDENNGRIEQLEAAISDTLSSMYAEKAPYYQIHFDVADMLEAALENKDD